MPPDSQLALSSLSNKNSVFQNPINSSYIGAYSLIRDIEDSPILIIKTSLFRDVYLQGQESIVAIALSLISIGVTFSVLVWITINMLVISPLTKLDKQVKSISQNPQASNLLQIKSTDEFSSLANSVNVMVSSLEKAQKLSAVGHLTTMVAHDLRNPLQSINTAAFGLKRKLNSTPDEGVIKLLNLIEESVKYSDKIINDLLDYSRELHLDLSVSELSELIKESLEQLEVPEKVKVINEISKGNSVKVDAYKIKRVFINIIRNAIEAMPNGGTLSLSSLSQNGNVEVVFADSGVGISADVLKRMGEPLFTTKAKGMGLGFVICKRIVEAHKGNISVESEVGKGTTIKVKLPVE